MILYLIISILVASLAMLARTKGHVKIVGGVFHLLQFTALAALITGVATTEYNFDLFEFDKLGTLFYLLLTIVGVFVFIHSDASLKRDSLSEYKLYYTLLMFLECAIAGVYFSSNIAITWIFLEATTLCAAGIVYHRRTEETLEATWKYIFVCSTGIAMAYLGILLLCSVAEGGSLSYDALAERIQEGNPLFLKIAFLLVLSGYSCKMEIFPLYTVGIDANFAAPSPAGALISTGLVNAGFLAIFRTYELFSATPIFEWAKSVMLIVGLLSLAIGAFFLRRTNNYKRFLSYSTVENMGLVAIGLGIGGIGAWAAIFHVVCHTFIKSSLFLQIGVVAQIYNSCRINRLGEYLSVNRVGAIALLIGTVVLLAFPPSPLFISELMLFKALFMDGSWWLAVVMLVLMCVVIYSVAGRVIRLCYQPSQNRADMSAVNKTLSWSALLLLIIAMVLGLWQPTILTDIITEIVTF